MVFEDLPVERLAEVVAGHDFTLDADATLDEQMGAAEVDAIAAYERVIRHAQAGQARLIEQLKERRRSAVRAQTAHGGAAVEDGDLTKSLICEVAMARQVSASGAATQVGFAAVLTRMPRTMALLAAGVIAERVAKAVTDECVGLAPADAATVDAQLADDLPCLTSRRAAEAARRLVLAIDPHAAHIRSVEERTDRYVAGRPGPHGTGYLEAKLTAEQMLACWSALDRTARGRKTEGDQRTIGQLMADALVERVTGQRRADDVGVEVNLLMRPESLLTDEDTPALLAGYGPLPAPLARRLSTGSRVWIRRLFTDPAESTITGRDPRRRRFDGPLGKLIRTADQHCARPWCDCRIIDIDHRIPYENGGPTTRTNADSYCRRSHTVRHLPGWQVRRLVSDEKGRQVLQWTTPTGHRYRSRRPAPLGHGPPVVVRREQPPGSVVEDRLLLAIAHAREPVIEYSAPRAA